MHKIVPFYRYDTLLFVKTINQDRVKIKKKSPRKSLETLAITYIKMEFSMREGNAAN